MSRIIQALWLLLALGACDAAMAQERVTLRATHRDGVPLHPAEGSRRMSGRAPDGARADVLRWGAGRRWLEIRVPDGRRGWISARYVSRPAEPSPTLDAVWRSAASCAARSSPAARASSSPRVASWNVRWFPDGSSHGPSDHPTDVSWLACAMASLNVDLIAVQEIMLHRRGRAAIARLERELSERTGGRWQSRFDGCPRDGRQHVGLLYDSSRVSLTNVQQLDAINPLGGCTGRLRPGLAARARFGDGRQLTVVTVHLDSGTDERDRAHRAQSLEQLVASRLGDALIIGDFNTMGTDALDANRELANLDVAIARGGLSRLSAETSCTEFYRRHGGQLDLALVSSSLRAATLEVAGPCAQLSCTLPRGFHPEALRQLSDHCPIVVDLGR